MKQVYYSNDIRDCIGLEPNTTQGKSVAVSASDGVRK